MLQKTIVCLTGIAGLFMAQACFAQATSYNISTVAGSGSSGYGGDGSTATGTTAKLNNPIQVAIGSGHDFYFTDSGNNRVRKVTASTQKLSTAAGITTAGYSGDGLTAVGSQLNDPYGVWVDAAGNIFIADLGNFVVRKINASDGKINTIAGDASANFNGDGGPATSAALNNPLGLVTDNSGNLFIADSFNHRIRVVTPDGNINTIAGGAPGFSGDGGPAINAQMNRPFGIALDAAGNLYIADSQNHRIRKVALDGTMSTVAGNGTAGFSGDGGPATKAALNRPWDVKVDAAGDLFIADYNNNRIRMVTPDGTITTIAGSAGPGYTGDGGAATSAKLNSPTGIALDGGNIYIADSSNNVIRMLTPTGPAISAGGVVTASAYGGSASIAPGSWIEIYGSNLSTGRRSWGAADFQGNNAPTSLDGTSVTIGGQNAFVDFISGGQVNAQVPSNVATGSQTVTVKTPAGTSASYTVTVSATQPGMLAPAALNVGGTQYLGAVFTDGATFVLPPGLIPGVASRRAKAGDTIIIYGVGFGPVNPNIPSGQIVQQSNQLITAPQILFGQTPATVSFAGLAPGYVGLYQINVVVPGIPASDKVPVTFTLGGVPGTQTFFTAVQ